MILWFCTFLESKFSPFCVWKEDCGSASSTWTTPGVQFHEMNHATVETATVLELFLPAGTTAPLLGTVQWICETCPRGKQDQRAILVLNQFISPICFRAPPQPQQPWQGVGKNGCRQRRNIQSQLCSQRIRKMESHLVSPRMLTVVFQRTLTSNSI